MSNIVEPQIVETKPSWFSDYIKNNPNMLKNIIGNTSSTPVLCKDGTTQNELSSPNAKYADACINNGGRAVVQLNTLDAQNQIAQQQALMQEKVLGNNNRLTDKVFGKTEGYGLERAFKLGAYIILGAVVGRYVAKNMKKSTTLGMVVGGLAPLLAFKLTLEYDKKNMPKQEPRQKVAMNPDGSIMTEKQIANTQVGSDLSKFIKSKPSPYMPQVMPSGLGFNLNCPNGTKKVETYCIKAPCPQMEVCA